MGALIIHEDLGLSLAMFSILINEFSFLKKYIDNTDSSKNRDGQHCDKTRISESRSKLTSIMFKFET